MGARPRGPRRPPPPCPSSLPGPVSSRCGGSLRAAPATARGPLSSVLHSPLPARLAPPAGRPSCLHVHVSTLGRPDATPALGCQQPPAPGTATSLVRESPPLPVGSHAPVPMRAGLSHPCVGRVAPLPRHRAESVPRRAARWPATVSAPNPPVPAVRRPSTGAENTLEYRAGGVSLCEWEPLMPEPRARLGLRKWKGPRVEPTPAKRVSGAAPLRPCQVCWEKRGSPVSTRPPRLRVPRASLCAAAGRKCDSLADWVSRCGFPRVPLLGTVGGGEGRPRCEQDGDRHVRVSPAPWLRGPGTGPQTRGRAGSARHPCLEPGIPAPALP